MAGGLRVADFCNEYQTEKVGRVGYREESLHGNNILLSIHGCLFSCQEVIEDCFNTDIPMIRGDRIESKLCYETET